MKLEPENITNDIEQNRKVQNFASELSNALVQVDIWVYNDYDETKFTYKNENKIWDRLEKLTDESIMHTNIEGASDGKLYKVLRKTEDKWVVSEYSEKYSNCKVLNIELDKLPANTKKGTFFREVKGNLVIDKETTEDIYHKMKKYENELINEQNENLSKMRKNGAIYKVINWEDDDEAWRTELTNVETGETFQELEMPHDIYHKIYVDSLVQYKNGTYNIVEGTSFFKMYPNDIEYTCNNFCDKEGVYTTKYGKMNTEEYSKLNIKKENIMTKISNKFREIINFFET